MAPLVRRNLAQSNTFTHRSITVESKLTSLQELILVKTPHPRLNVTKNVKVSDEPFEFCGAKVTPVRLEISFPDGAVLKLGRKELGILAYLNAHPGQVITRKALIHSVWGMHADVKSRSLDQYIVKVRDLFAAHGLELNAFRTVHGIGYIFDPTGVSAEGR